MANRRMFSKTIINSARFLRMPPTSRLLYYDLGMHADDDGIVEAYSVMRMTQCNEDDLRVLVARGFVRILNGDLVSLILDWNENNYIQKDRYHPSIYKNLALQLTEGECIQDVSSMDTEVRLGKVRSGKDRSGEDSKAKAEEGSERFKLFWSAYPRHVARQNAVKAFVKLNPDNALLSLILRDLETRKKTEAWQKNAGQFIPHAATYLNGRRWEDETPSSPAPNDERRASEPNWFDEE